MNFNIKKFKNNYNLCDIVFIGLVFKPSAIDNYSILDTLWNIGRILIILIAIYKVITTTTNGKIRKIYFFILLFGLSNLIATIIFSGSIKNYIISIGIGVALVILSDYQLRKQPIKFINSSAFILGLYVIINFFTIVAFPSGFYIVNNYTIVDGISVVKDTVPCYFLGFRNVMITTILPAIGLNMIKININKKKKNVFSFVVITCGILSFFILWSATSIFVMFMFFMTYLLSKNMSQSKLIKLLCIICISFFIGIVILRLQELFKFIIVDMLKKDLTFTGRTSIWTKTIEMIKENFFIGYGIQEHDYYVKRIGASHAHNYYLDILLRGGIIAFISFIMLTIQSAREVIKSNKTLMVRVLLSMMFAIFIAFETEAYINATQLFIFFSLAININEYNFTEN